MFSIDSATTPGRRPRNEDAAATVEAWLARSAEPLAAAAVCDGVGSCPGSDEAAAYAASGFAGGATRAAALTDRLEDDEAFAHVLAAGVRAAAESCNALRRGATTIVGLVATPHAAGVAWAGDSTALLLSGGDLTLLTRPHTPRQRRIDEGSSGRDPESETGILTQAISSATTVAPGFVVAPLHAGDAVLLASDGLDALEPSAIAQAAREAPPGPGLAGRLVSAAVRAGSTDNVTALIVTRTHAPSPARRGSAGRPWAIARAGQKESSHATSPHQ